MIHCESSLPDCLSEQGLIFECDKPITSDFSCVELVEIQLILLILWFSLCFWPQNTVSVQIQIMFVFCSAVSFSCLSYARCLLGDNLLYFIRFIRDLYSLKVLMRCCSQPKLTILKKIYVEYQIIIPILRTWK